MCEKAAWGREATPEDPEVETALRGWDGISLCTPAPWGKKRPGHAWGKCQRRPEEGTLTSPWESSGRPLRNRSCPLISKSELRQEAHALVGGLSGEDATPRPCPRRITPPNPKRNGEVSFKSKELQAPGHGAQNEARGDPRGTVEGVGAFSKVSVWKRT